MRSGFRRVAVGAVAVATLAVGCSSGGGGGGALSATDFVHSVCLDAKTFVTTVLSSVTDLEKALSPQSTPAEGKQLIQGALSKLAQAVDTLKSALEGLGAPNVANGAEVKATLDSAFTQIQTNLKKAETDAANLPTSDAQSFQTAAQALAREIESSTAPLSALSKLKSTELETAAKKDPACQSVGNNP